MQSFLQYLVKIVPLRVKTNFILIIEMEDLSTLLEITFS